MEFLVANVYISDSTDLKNALAWFALEEVCRQLVGQDAHIPECEECCAILEDDGTCADCDAEEEGNLYIVYYKDSYEVVEDTTEPTQEEYPNSTFCEGPLSTMEDVDNRLRWMNRK